jgi:hypothetical protein
MSGRAPIVAAHLGEGASLRASQKDIMTRTADAARPGFIRRFLATALSVAALSLSLASTSFAGVIYLSDGFDDALNCDPASCNRTGLISDARLGNSEVGSAFRLRSDSQIDGFSWIGDHFGDDSFVLRLYDALDGHPTDKPFYQQDIGANFTASKLNPDQGFFGGWLLNASISPLLLPADTTFYASLSATLDSMSPLLYSWDTGPHTSGQNQFGRNDEQGGAWFDASGRIAAFRLSGVEVAEPSMLALLAVGLALLMVMRRRRPAHAA